MSEDIHKPDHNDDKSTGAVIAEIAKLLLLLLWKGVKALGRIILKFLKFLLRWFAKGLLWTIDATDNGIQRFKRFWNDNDTQEKRRKIGLWFKNAGKAILRGIFLFFIVIFKGLAWVIKKSINAVIHLKPTVLWVWKGLKKSAKAVGNWFAGLGISIANWTKLKYRRFREYKKDKNFKEMLIDMRTRLKGSINDYIEEDQSTEADSESEENIDSGKIVTDTEFDEDDENANIFKRTGKSIYKAIKKLVEI